MTKWLHSCLVIFFLYLSLCFSFPTPILTLICTENTSVACFSPGKSAVITSHLLNSFYSFFAYEQLLTTIPAMAQNSANTNNIK